ncbi:homoserine dehydrogenase [Clostridiisalibacter paucivorans]|uniref:homoserine dehydrogenase n=1 Tax=Clostridiisalibacter paucivorans TaxID=408753 RepID=UPI000687CB7E|nr:homoserine dehydrogenase [Clostridiisalibacter paucivorans]
MANLGLLGIGTVGSGVYEILNERKTELESLTGTDINIEKILVRDINKKRDNNIPSSLFTEEPKDIIDNPDIDIVVEVMGGIHPTLEYITTALKNGKHVVTANKAVIANHTKELIELADKYDRALLFEASVGGGIPVLKPLKQASSINNIEKIQGILNGTTNFILSKMTDENLGFDEALDLAHKLGYAEADPTDDIEGYDAARKVAILSSIAFKSYVGFNDVVCRGITNVNILDIELFKSLGLVVKLLGNSIKCGNNFSASVEPVLVDANSQLGNVNDAFNVVSVEGDFVGELQFYGQGAGKGPTANAVVSDILDILNKEYKSYSLKNSNNLTPSGVRLFKGQYYLRLSTDDKSKYTKIINILKKSDIEYSIIYMEKDLALLTESISANVMEDIVKELDVPNKALCYLRIEKKIELSNVSQLAV